MTVTSNPIVRPPCQVGDGVWQGTEFGFTYCAAFPTACTRNGSTLLSCTGFPSASLALRNFNLTTVAKGALAGLTLSGDLDLSRNAIAAVAAGALTGTKVGGTISLAYNNLTEVPLSALGDVVAGTVDLSDNPLLRLPSEALSPQYSDYVSSAIATPVSCEEPGWARFGWKGSSFCTRCLPGEPCATLRRSRGEQCASSGCC